MGGVDDRRIPRILSGAIRIRSLRDRGRRTRRPYKRTARTRRTIRTDQLGHFDKVNDEKQKMGQRRLFGRDLSFVLDPVSGGPFFAFLFPGFSSGNAGVEGTVRIDPAWDRSAGILRDRSVRSIRRW